MRKKYRFHLIPHDSISKKTLRHIPDIFKVRHRKRWELEE